MRSDREREPALQPLGADSFEIEVDGVSPAHFVACRGLGARTRFLAVPEGGVETPRLFETDTQWEPLVLERVFEASSDFWEWFEAGEPRDGTIRLVRPDGSVAGSWRVSRGRAARWAAPELDAGRGSVAVELVEIVHEGVRWENP